MVSGQFQNIDRFLQEAEGIYGDMYKIGDRHPLEFLQNIFDVTKRKLHTKYVDRKQFEEALGGQGLVPVKVVKERRPIVKPNKMPKITTRGVGSQAKTTAKADNNDDDDDDKQSVPKSNSPRNVHSVINDSALVKNANDFLNKYKL